ncbi:MAG: hypothetical protein K6G29_11435 [Clostridiales bacterium]|nr:hypothetical protein [Clostridiales bacterium]
MISKTDLRRAEKLLRELPYMESALVYYDSLAETPLARRDRRILRVKRAGLRDSVEAAERALSLLTPEERKVADCLFLSPESDLGEVCAACAMEKSSVYRKRRRILEKVALAVWGGGL